MNKKPWPISYEAYSRRASRVVELERELDAVNAKVDRLRKALMEAHTGIVNEYGRCWCNQDKAIIFKHEPQCVEATQALADTEGKR